MANDGAVEKLVLMERLAEGPVICAEGYLFELERRGYVQAGPFVPIVVLDNPEAVRQLHIDFARAGSDIIEAFTYYGHREKLRVIGMEQVLESLNRQALQIAKDVADETGTLLAANISNTNLFEPDDPESHRKVRAIFDEQLGWAADYYPDLVVAETFSFAGEAEIAVAACRELGVPMVVTMAVHREPMTMDGLSPADTCRKLQDMGAHVVGLNCLRGPDTMLPLLSDIRAAVSCPVAALPVPYRTTEAAPTFQSLRDPACHCIPDDRPFPVALDPFTCNRYELAEFAVACRSMGVDYIGVCCGAGPHHIRAVAEALGRTPEASRFSPDMSKHAFFGSDAVISEKYKERRTLL
ncbi:MAG: homocysteine S-methyltransferase family protein [Azospirillaceae bacterium]